MNRPNIHRTIVSLKDRRYITPNYIRLTFTGSDIAAYSECRVGINNKIFIPPKGEKEVHFPDPSKTDQEDLDKLAFRRTYTHVGMDLEKQELFMDFVAHGTEGPASDFAINAEIGSKIGVAMKIHDGELVPEAEHYYIIGDSTALPVMIAILGDINPSSKGAVFIEVSSEEDKQDIIKPEGVAIHWIVNAKTEEDTLLADQAVAYMESQPQQASRFAFVACEYNNVKKMRNYLRKEKNWSREELSAYSYWKYGVAETKSEADRRKEREDLID